MPLPFGSGFNCSEPGSFSGCRSFEASRTQLVLALALENFCSCSLRHKIPPPLPCLEHRPATACCLDRAVGVHQTSKDADSAAVSEKSPHPSLQRAEQPIAIAAAPRPRHVALVLVLVLVRVRNAGPEPQSTCKPSVLGERVEGSAVQLPRPPVQRSDDQRPLLLLQCSPHGPLLKAAAQAHEAALPVSHDAPLPLQLLLTNPRAPLDESTPQSRAVTRPLLAGLEKGLEGGPTDVECEWEWERVAPLGLRLRESGHVD